MNENKWWSYVERTLDGDSALSAGRRAGFDASAFTRWKNGSRPDVLFVIKFARAYNRNVLEALAAADYITEEEAALREVHVGVEDLSLRELASELVERLTPALEDTRHMADDEITELALGARLERRSGKSR